MSLLHPASFHCPEVLIVTVKGRLSLIKAPINHNVPRNLCETGFHWIYKKTFGHKFLVTFCFQIKHMPHRHGYPLSGVGFLKDVD